MKKDYEHVSILLDRSGSMDSIKNDVIGGFNHFIEEQKKVPGEMSVSLLSFATQGDYKVVYDVVKLADIKPLDDRSYHPSGMTALNDSFVRLINLTGQKLDAMPEDQRPDKVLIVCITHGEENNSIEHTTEALKSIIEHQKNQYNWEFMYIGANQDAFAEAAKRGINTASAFAATSVGTQSMYDSFSTSNTRYRKGGKL
jgi:uncharacterized protein YegL